MKLEAADSNDPEMIYVATVSNVMEVNMVDTKTMIYNIINLTGENPNTL